MAELLHPCEAVLHPRLNASCGSLARLNLVPCTACNTTRAAFGTYDQISRALIAPGDPYRVLGALWWRPARVGDRRLDHFLAQDRSRRGRAIQFECAAALRDMGRICL